MGRRIPAIRGRRVVVQGGSRELGQGPRTLESPRARSGPEGARTVVRIDQKENERKIFRRRGAALPEALPLTLLSASRLLVFQAFQVLYSFPRTL